MTFDYTELVDIINNYTHKENEEFTRTEKSDRNDAFHSGKIECANRLLNIFNRKNEDKMSTHALDHNEF